MFLFNRNRSYKNDFKFNQIDDFKMSLASQIHCEAIFCTKYPYTIIKWIKTKPYELECYNSCVGKDIISFGLFKNDKALAIVVDSTKIEIESLKNECKTIFKKQRALFKAARNISKIMSFMTRKVSVTLHWPKEIDDIVSKLMVDLV